MLILDLKTVPDPAAGKRLLALEKFGDAETLLAMRTLRVAGQGDADVPAHVKAQVPPHLCRVVAATLVRVDAERCELQSFDGCAAEADALRALDAAVAEAMLPVFVWNAGHGARALLAARALAWHLALPQLLAGSGPRCLTQHHALDPIPLAELAAVHGLPHRLGLAAHEIELCATKGMVRLRAGCEADALMTALLHIALEVAAGRLSATTASSLRQRVSHWLKAQTAAHWLAFAQQWDST